MANRNLDKEYSPSAWTKRFSTADEVFRYHVNVTTEETQRNLQKYKVLQNVSYGDRDMERMDIYYETEEGSPIVVYIHGGYWQELSKNESGYPVSPLLEKGFRVVVLDYDLCPSVTLEQVMDEIKMAMKAIFEYAERTDAKSVSIVGHSAGAHLAICALQKDISNEIHAFHKLTSVFLISGIYDLTELKQTVINRDNILSLNDSNVKFCSPMFYSFRHLEQMHIKFYVFVAANDSSTFIKQSEDFHKHLHLNGLKSEFRIVPECDHFDIVENLAQNDYEITRKIIEEVLG